MASDRDQLADLLDIHLGDPERDTVTREFMARETATLIIEMGWRPPAREITDPAELDALPVGTVGVAPSGVVWQRWRDRWTANGSTCTSAYLARHRGPLAIVHVPTEEPTDGQ